MLVWINEQYKVLNEETKEEDVSSKQSNTAIICMDAYIQDLELISAELIVRTLNFDQSKTYPRVNFNQSIKEIKNSQKQTKDEIEEPPRKKPKFGK